MSKCVTRHAHLTLVQMIDDSVGIKARVEEVLNTTGYSEQRAAKMTIDDLLKQVVFLTSFTRVFLTSFDARLLSAFHDQGIHFA